MLMFFQIPTAMYQTVVEQIPGRVEAFIAAKGINADGFEIKCATSTYEWVFGFFVHIFIFLKIKKNTKKNGTHS